MHGFGHACQCIIGVATSRQMLLDVPLQAQGHVSHTVGTVSEVAKDKTRDIVEDFMRHGDVDLLLAVYVR